MNVNNNYDQLVDIAKNAYGSGVLEKSKGGNGYVGQYTDAAGQTHVVKMLTHKSERTAFAARKSGGTDVEEMARATNDLKAKLIEIAGGEGTELGGKIKQMLESAQKKAVSEHMTAGEAGVGLLSRKIVAQAVTAIAEKTTFKNAQNQDVTFSWKDINGTNRAATVKNTQANAVNGTMARERALADAYSIEGAWKNSWKKNILTRDPKIAADDVRAFAEILYAMQSAYEKSDASMFVSQRLKGLLQNGSNDFSECLKDGVLRDALSHLHDDMSAKEVLAMLRGHLDVDADLSAQGRGVLALRVLLEEISMYESYGVSTRTLHACGMSVADFDEAVSAMAEKFHLSDAKKQSVGRVIASYLTALAEEGKTGRVDANGRPIEGLPSKDELKRQIADGTFGGTYFGLLHVRAACDHDIQIQSPDRLFGLNVCDLAGILTDDECADAAYFIAKIGTGPRAKIPDDNELSVLVLRKLLDNREKLMSLRQENGKLSINDISRVIGGPSEFEADDEDTSIAMALNDFFEKQLYDKILTRYPGAAKEWKNCAHFSTGNLANLLSPMGRFGVSEDVAVKLFLGEEIDNFQVSDKASAYDVTSDLYTAAVEADFVDWISSDIDRTGGDSKITVGGGDNAYVLTIPVKNGSAAENAKGLMKALNGLLGGGEKIGNPMSNQLKTLCFLCGQAGNEWLTLAGGTSKSRDHGAMDKSFALQEDGSVLYTASSLDNGVKHTVQFQIETDGTSHLVSYSRQEDSKAFENLLTTVKGAVTTRLDMLRKKCSEKEAANLNNYNDTIFTEENVRTLKKKVSKALLRRPESVVPNVMANLMAFFAEINLRQQAKGLPLDSFETLLSRYAGSDELIRQLDFSLTSKEIYQVAFDMHDWLIEDFKENQKHVHVTTNVYMPSMREYDPGSVTINGERPPEKPSGENVVVGDRTVSVNELKQGVSGADTPERVAFHEMLIAKFPDPKVRLFVSFLLSMSDGVKGCYDSLFYVQNAGKEARNHNGKGAPSQYLQFTLLGGGVLAQPSNYDIENKGIFAITIEPDELDSDGRLVKKGKIKVVTSCAESMCLLGKDLDKLHIGKDQNKDTMQIARQKYETTITIDPNVFDKDGIPSFKVENPVLK